MVLDSSSKSVHTPEGSSNSPKITNTRRRSVTLQPLTALSKKSGGSHYHNISHSNQDGSKNHSIRGDKQRVYSVSSDIIPQTLPNTREEYNSQTGLSASELHINSNYNDISGNTTSNSIIDKSVISNNNDNLQKLSNNVNNNNNNTNSINSSSGHVTPKWSTVGFQSIFQGPGLRKSNASLRSQNSSSSDLGSINGSKGKNSHKSRQPNTTHHLKTAHITPMRKSSDSFERPLKTHNSIHPLNHRYTTNDIASVHSGSDLESNGYGKIRRNSIFSLSTIKDNGEKLFKSNSNASSNLNLSNTLIDSSIMGDNKSVRSPQKLTVKKIRSKRDNTVSSMKSANSTTSDSISTTSSSGSNNPFIKITRKIFRTKSSHHIKDTAEPAIPTSLSKFLHSSVGRHRSPVHFIHNTTGGIMDSGKSVYSFNPTVMNTTSDAALAITQQDDSFDANNVAILHDLLKNLTSLETNYKNFNSQELLILSGNIWGIFCSVVVELFRNQRIWQLPAKIEDINRILRFYIQLKTQSKIATTWTKIYQEMEDFIITSLYVFQNQVVFNYNNEDTMNTALKRLDVLWQIFYQEIYYDLIAVLIPLETSFQNHTKHRSNSSTKRDGGTGSSNNIKGNIKDSSDVISINIDNNLESEVLGSKRVNSEGLGVMTNGSTFNNSTLSTIATASSNSSSSNLMPNGITSNNNNSNSNNILLDLNIDFNRGNGANGMNTTDSNINSSTTNVNKNLHGVTNNVLSVEHLLLKCFRDSIVLPYYQNFIHSDDGVSKSFYTYILNEEEESGVTEDDKLTLLQCFGILSTIQGHDSHQQVMEDLLEGVRMSI